ncbi:MAG: Gfo/Idh/MocA family protein [Beutenbergiaceae bacterium]
MKELRVALIGGGFMGKAHSLAYAIAPFADSLGAAVTRQVLVEASPDLATRFAAELGWAESSADWRAVIERPDIDIVDICTPPQFHAAIALAAIEAGKHVFCEKPITNDAAEARAMREAARAAGVVVQVGFNYRHTPAVRFAKQLLDSGALGVPLQFRGSYLQETAFTADPHRWRATRATGGSGTVGDIGSHIIDMAEYLFGDIRKVAARARSKIQPDPGTGWMDERRRLDEDLIEEAGVWVAEFANGAIGTFAVDNWAIGSKNRISFEFDATKAAVQFDWNDREVFRVAYVDDPPDHQGFREIHTNSTHPDGWWKLAGLGTGYLEVSAIQLQKFLRAAAAGEPAEPDFTTGTHVQQVVEAIMTAATTDTWVDVTPREA